MTKEFASATPAPRFVRYLTFHGVGPIPRLVDEGERDCWLDQQHFEEVLDAIVDCPNVRLTVDDGNASDWAFILPALLRRRLHATFFVCSGRFGHPTFLSREQILDLKKNGMQIGSHGVEHRRWRNLSDSDLKFEVENSRAELQALCNVAVDSAACPFGSYDRRVCSALKKAGYSHVFTSDRGVADVTRWLKPRVTVRRSTSAQSIYDLVRSNPSWHHRSIGALRLLSKSLR